MNVVLWIVQVLVGLAFVAAGYTHGFRAEQMRSQQGMQWIAAVPRGLLNFIALSEILGGIGVIVPALTGILPWLTPLAAAGLALIMLLAAGFHLMRREYPNIVFNLILLALAAFVAYGRFVIQPL
ncbi:MAG: DoxX family protein [Chloroflexi bacterium]|nr:DoxX family protein [Chloroflexota bacterium]MCI0577369.1 DoxX family protein [Chloroflexota bacterium]MCI0647056.1 DoxX family protein [Chloroflexota bacterium]MCI0731543.1 DoxX family protein [Chloroflexota bacterium]